MKLAPYPKYKPSGIEWLGDVPEHWEVKPVKLGFDIQLGKMLQPDASGPQDSEVHYLKAQHVQWETVQTVDLPTMWASSTDEAKYGVTDGDLLVCEGGDVGRAGFIRDPPSRTIIQNALHRVRPHGYNDSRLLMYVLEHAADHNWFDILCNRATIAHFTGEKFGALRVPLPPQKEQRVIAEFLDRETAKIDTLMAKKQTLIERLKEKRTALISRTVTRGLPPDAASDVGLDPHPKFKTSGIEWLGEVPEHWYLKRLKMSVRLADKKVEVDEENPAPYIGLENIESWTGRLLHIVLDVVPTGTSNAFKSGDTLFGKLRPYLAKACNPEFDGLSSTELLVMKGIDLDRRTLLYSLLSDGFIKLVDSSTYGSKMPRASWGFIGNCIMPIAPSDEQRAIADFLDRETAKIDQMVAKVETAIERLQEYRTALITAAVTGKIDVRESVPHHRSRAPTDKLQRKQA